MGTKHKTSKQTIESTRKQARALELRLAGWTLDAIAQQLGYANRSGAWWAIKAGLDKTLQPAADEYREIEKYWLDALWRKLWERLHSPGHLPVAQLVALVGRLLDVSERRCELLGLDAPIKIAPTDPAGVFEYAGLSDSEIVAEFVSLIERAKQRPDANTDDDPGDRAWTDDKGFDVGGTDDEEP